MSITTWVTAKSMQTSDQGSLFLLDGRPPSPQILLAALLLCNNSVRLPSSCLSFVYRHALKKHSSAGPWSGREREKERETTKASLTLTLYGGTKVKPQNDAWWARWDKQNTTIHTLTHTHTLSLHLCFSFPQLLRGRLTGIYTKDKRQC